MTPAKTTTRSRRNSRTKAEGPRKTPTQGWRVIRWIERNCVFTKAQWRGKPFRLQAWQKRLLLELFELVPDPENPDVWIRRFRWALIGVPKKNGKTELAAALALYFLLGDEEPAPIIPCAAASDEQADLVFGAGKTMVEESPTLSRACEAFDKEILVPTMPGSELKRIAAVGGAGDGTNVFVAILDELHEWLKAKHVATWNVITGSSGVRRQPMVVQITTAGFDLDTICGHEYEYGLKVESGEIDDPTYFFRWWGAGRNGNGDGPQGDADTVDVTDPAVWALANPSFGVTVRADYLEGQLRKKPRNVFKRYYLNLWTESDEAWLPDGAWDALRADWLEPGERLIPESGVTVGKAVDLGLKKDTAAILTMQLRDDGLVAVEAEILDPREGQVTFGMVEQALREDAARRDVAFVAYDPWRFARSAELLSDEGMFMVEVPMTNERTVPMTDRLYQAICDDQRIVHDGDPKLRAHVQAGALKDTERGPRLAKASARKSVDALIAMMLGLPLIDEALGSGFGFE